MSQNARTVNIPARYWVRLAEVIEDIGNYHPRFSGTPIGSDLDVLGNAIKNGIFMCENPIMNVFHQQWLDKAKQVIVKHGGERDGLDIIEHSIEVAGKLIGTWDKAGNNSNETSI